MPCHGCWLLHCLPALDVAVPVVAVLPVRLPERGDGAAHRSGDGGHAGHRAAPDQRGDAVSHQIQRLAVTFILLTYIVNLEIKQYQQSLYHYPDTLILSLVWV